MGGVICISEVIDISPGNLDSSLCLSSPAFLMVFSAYKLNKQGDNIQPWCIWNQSVFPWELDYKESWGPKNWCFWTVVSEKILESLLDCKEIQPVHCEGNQPWDFFGRNAKAETLELWPPHVKSWLIGKDSDAGRNWVQEEKGMAEYEMAGWHHWLHGREFG